MENSKSQLSNTGYKGIYFDKAIGKFVIYIAWRQSLYYGNSITHNVTKKIHLGQYETLKEAVKAREEFIKSLF